MHKRRNWSFIGFADDLGVMNVGGRIGASLGPTSFERSLKRFNGQVPIWETLRSSQILSTELIQIDKLEDRYAFAGEALAKVAKTSDATIAVGGGHDYGYAHLLGLKTLFPKIGCINIDAHLDVRPPSPEPTSGSPFYMAIENKIIAPLNLVEFGIQAQSNGPKLWKYVNDHSVTVHPFQSLRNGQCFAEFKKAIDLLHGRCDTVVVQLDLDSVCEASAPGVSAPQSEGFSPSDVFTCLEYAATLEKVTSLGIYELNPLHDLGDRTSRLAATAAWRFLSSKL